MKKTKDMTSEALAVAMTLEEHRQAIREAGEEYRARKEVDRKALQSAVDFVLVEHGFEPSPGDVRQEFVAEEAARHRQLAAGRIQACEEYLADPKSTNFSEWRYVDLIGILTGGHPMKAGELITRLDRAATYLRRCAEFDDVPVDSAEQVKDMLAILLEGKVR